MPLPLRFLLFIFGLALPFSSWAQQEEDPLEAGANIVDEIQFDLKSTWIEGDTLNIELFAISYEKGPREFRLNVFGSGLIDAQGQSHLLHSVQIERVLVPLSARENYLNYLLQQDKAVQIHLKAILPEANLKDEASVKLVFSSFEDPGHFLEAILPLPLPQLEK